MKRKTIRRVWTPRLTLKEFKELHKLVDQIFDEADELGLTWQDLSNRAGIAYVTVWRLVKFLTRWPQAQTIVLLGKAVGFTIRWEKSRKHQTV